MDGAERKPSPYDPSCFLQAGVVQKAILVLHGMSGPHEGTFMLRPPGTFIHYAGTAVARVSTALQDTSSCVTLLPAV